MRYSQLIKFFTLLFLAPQLVRRAFCALLPSTDSDPKSFVADCVNVITGDYCENAVDLALVPGTDDFLVKRFFNVKNYMTGQKWRLEDLAYRLHGGREREFDASSAVFASIFR